MLRKNFYLMTLLVFLSACGADNEEDKDTQKPIINSEKIVACPGDCEQFVRGGIMHFTYVFQDNKELGKYNIEIHNNFNHHTHSTSAVECDMDDEKQPEKPWVYNQDFDIPSGQKSYISQITIPIPDDIDKGDYHFMIRLTDKVGWQEIKSVAIKIVD